MKKNHKVCYEVCFNSHFLRISFKLCFIRFRSVYFVLSFFFFCIKIYFQKLEIKNKQSNGGSDLQY